MHSEEEAEAHAKTTSNELHRRRWKTTRAPRVYHERKPSPSVGTERMLLRLRRFFGNASHTFASFARRSTTSFSCRRHTSHARRAASNSIRVDPHVGMHDERACKACPSHCKRVYPSEARRTATLSPRGQAYASAQNIGRTKALLNDSSVAAENAGEAARCQPCTLARPSPKQERTAMALRGGANQRNVDNATKAYEASTSRLDSDGRGRNLIPLLERCIEQDRKRRSRGFLCRHVEHLACIPGQDFGWGCGWRNIQMMCSYLLHRDDGAADALCFGLQRIPSIGELQDYLEMAWAAGFDVEGARQLGNRVKGTTKWIGTTECAALLRMFGFRALIADFKITESNKGSLLEWVWNYFSQGGEADLAQTMTISSRSPLYFQHEGHSRIIVGVEKLTRPPLAVEEITLLVLDPNISRQSVYDAMENASGWQQLVRRSKDTLRNSEYQLLWVGDGIAQAEEKEGLKMMHAIERHGF